MSLTGIIKQQLTLVHSKALDLSTPEENLFDPTAWFNWTVTDGTAINQANLAWHDQRTLAGGASEDLDLSGSLINAFGDTMSFARVKGIYITADSDNVDSVSVGGASSNTWLSMFGSATDTIKVMPGGVFCNFAPDATAFPVTAGTADILKILNDDGATAAIYNILIIGANA